MEGPSPGFNYVNFGVRLLLQQSFLVGRWTLKSTEPETGLNLQGEINSYFKLCHDPEDGAVYQTLVGDDA
jgi:hypothetical protein